MSGGFGAKIQQPVAAPECVNVSLGRHVSKGVATNATLNQRARSSYIHPDQRTGSYIYFIKPVGLDGPVKIGRSEMPELRMQSMALAGPFKIELEMLAKAPGGAATEAWLHKRFKRCRSHGEWFHPNDELQELIRQTRKNGAIPGTPEDLPIFKSRKPQKPLVAVDATIIKMLGGANRVAAALGISQPAVSNWRKRGITLRHRVLLAQLAEREGKQLPADFLTPFLSSSIR